MYSKSTWKSKYFGNILEYKYKYSGFLRNVLKYIPSTLQIVLKYRCTWVQSTPARLWYTHTCIHACSQHILTRMNAYWHVLTCSTHAYWHEGAHARTHTCIHTYNHIRIIYVRTHIQTCIHNTVCTAYILRLNHYKDHLPNIALVLQVI